MSDICISSLEQQVHYLISEKLLYQKLIKLTPIRDESTIEVYHNLISKINEVINVKTILIEEMKVKFIVRDGHE